MNNSVETVKVFSKKLNQFVEVEVMNTEKNKYDSLDVMLVVDEEE